MKELIFESNLENNKRIFLVDEWIVLIMDTLNLDNIGFYIQRKLNKKIKFFSILRFLSNDLVIGIKKSIDNGIVYV